MRAETYSRVRKKLGLNNFYTNSVYTYGNKTENDMFENYLQKSEFVINDDVLSIFAP